MSMDNNVVIAAERHRDCHRRTVKLCCDVLSKALPSLAMVSISEGRRTSTATGFAPAKERLEPAIPSSSARGNVIRFVAGALLIRKLIRLRTIQRIHDQEQR
jgi:hypothetical protein